MPNYTHARYHELISYPAEGEGAGTRVVVRS